MIRERHLRKCEPLQGIQLLITQCYLSIFVCRFYTTIYVQPACPNAFHIETYSFHWPFSVIVLWADSHYCWAFCICKHRNKWICYGGTEFVERPNLNHNMLNRANYSTFKGPSKAFRVAWISPILDDIKQRCNVMQLQLLDWKTSSESISIRGNRWKISSDHIKTLFAVYNVQPCVHWPGETRFKSTLFLAGLTTQYLLKHLHVRSV